MTCRRRLRDWQMAGVGAARSYRFTVQDAAGRCPGEPRQLRGDTPDAWSGDTRSTACGSAVRSSAAAASAPQTSER